jgi:glycerate kinase
VVNNDDSCGIGSSMTFTMNSGDTVTIYEGCFDDTQCSGTVVITITSTSQQVQTYITGTCPTPAPTGNVQYS